MSNRFRVTAASFFAYFVMSGMLAPLGILSAPIAADFGLSVAAVTARYSWLTGGIWIGAVAALVVFRWLRVKTLMWVLYAVIAISLASLLITSSAQTLALRLGAIGICCGIGLPAAAFTIARSYSDARRASMLVITDGFFSVAGMLCGWLAVALLSRDLHWSWGFQLVTVVAIAVLLLSVFSDYPESEAPLQTSAPAAPSAARWPAAVWLFIAALCLYTFAQNSILLWLPQHAQTARQLDATAAGSLVGQFWLGMFAAQLFVAWWVLRIGPRRLLGLAAAGTLLLSLPLQVASDARLLTAFALLWGFANLGLLKIAISCATQLVPSASPQLVSMLLLGATTGTAISPSISSALVARGSAGDALLLGSVCYALMLLLLGVALRKPPPLQAEQPLAAEPLP